MEKKKYLEAGEIVNTHGIKGEVKMIPWADSVDFLKKFRTLYIDSKPVKVLSSRPHGKFLIAKLEGVEDVNAAMSLKGKTVYIDRADAKLPKGHYFIADIIGAQVVTDTGEELGLLQEVMELPANDVYVVKGEKEILIPAVDEFIVSVDAEAGIITVHVIEGLI